MSASSLGSSKYLTAYPNDNIELRHTTLCSRPENTFHLRSAKFQCLREDLSQPDEPAVKLPSCSSLLTWSSLLAVVSVTNSVCECVCGLFLGFRSHLSVNAYGDE